MEIHKHRIDFVLLFDVEGGNPNGDPMDGNKPRTDPFDGHGLVTDACVKRKVRDYLSEVHGLPIFVNRDGIALNTLIEACAEPERYGKKPGKGMSYEQFLHVKSARGKRVAEKYVDVRLFGGMLETSDQPAGRVRGPVQVSFARSTHPIRVSKHQIARVSITKEGEEDKASTFGDKWYVDYALYKMAGSYTPHLGSHTGVTQQDLERLFEAMVQCWPRDRSAARGTMGCRGLYLAVHDRTGEHGDARCHASDLHAAVRVESASPPRSWSDVSVTLATGQPGITWLTYGASGLVPAPQAGLLAAPASDGGDALAL